MVVVVFELDMRPDADLAEYEARATRMDELVRQMPGFISYSAYSSEGGHECVVARFESEEALHAWHYQPEHVETQQRGREAFFEQYHVQVCTPVREYQFQRQPQPQPQAQA
ncbi:MAG TPA: antibiotic biosynthesis monooxygenase [Ktedonobacterales bacterium]